MPPCFPMVERRELADPPLEFVVCQIRYPTILALAAKDPPKGFQERVRATYPIATPRESRNVEIRPQEGEARFSTQTRWWCFEDAEAHWTVSLGQDFLALEAKRYRSFDDFIKRFEEVFGIARDLYPIELRERLGLRYVDRISREKYPRLPEDWARKINPEMIPLRSRRSPPDPQLANLEARFAFGDRFLAVRSSYLDESFSGAPSSQLVLDFDCYTEKRAGLGELAGALRDFQSICYRAFRWAIGDLIEDFEIAAPGE